jgi:hypothetical protein
MTVDEVLARIREQLNLEADTEREVLEEIRSHLEEAVEAARGQGMSEEAALAEAASRFGVDEVGQELQDVHLGWGMADGITAAALPVLCALILRWVVFAPNGTLAGWREMLARPTFWGVAALALLFPLLKFSRWRYALASWVVFWVLSVIFAIWPAMQW